VKIRTTRDLDLYYVDQYLDTTRGSPVRKFRIGLIISLLILWLIIPSLVAAQPSADSVVRAVLFYSPTCSHCHKVITEVLIPMVENYGADRLQIIGVDITQPAGGEIYQATIDMYEIPPNRQGVPTLVVGETILVGSAEIPEVFPDLVEKGLKEGGIDWPQIPGLEQVISPKAGEQPTPTNEPQPTATTSSSSTIEPTATWLPSPTAPPTRAPTPTFTPPPVTLALGNAELPPTEPEEIPPDPVGFTLTAAVLLGMVAAIAYAAWRVINDWQRLFQLDRNPPASPGNWVIPVLALLGLGVATYLAYVEITHVEAVCGPVGECNVVQSSPYAQILGIPIAVLGIANYLATFALWVAYSYLRSHWANLAALLFWALTLFGTLFSIYLTCLELFVIHAICAWCLSSAVITTLLMLLVVIPVTSKES
jgi:uncharacterized membrane protein